MSLNPECEIFLNKFVMRFGYKEILRLDILFNSEDIQKDKKYLVAELSWNSSRLCSNRNSFLLRNDISGLIRGIKDMIEQYRKYTNGKYIHKSGGVIITESLTEEEENNIKKYPLVIPILKELEELLDLVKIESKENKNINAYDLVKILISIAEEKEKKVNTEIIKQIIDKLNDIIKEINNRFSKNLSINSLDDLIYAFFYEVRKNIDVRIDEVFVTKQISDKYSIDIKNISDSKIEDLVNRINKKLKTDLYKEKLEKEEAVTGINLEGLNGTEFEDELNKIFTKIGYDVITTPSTNDQGADLILSRNNEKIAVQAKYYKGSVSNKAVQEVVASMKYYNCNKGIVVSTGKFTKGAKELAMANGIELWDKEKLLENLNNLNHFK